MTAGFETQCAAPTVAALVQTTQVALQTTVADANAEATAGAADLAAEAARAHATQAALQTTVADANAEATAGAARARATQAALQADLATLETDADHVHGQLDAAGATQAAASAALAATLEAETAHGTTFAETLDAASTRVYVLEQTATPAAAQLVTLEAALEAVQTDLYEYLAALPTATPTVRFTHLPPPTGTPPVSIGDVYEHSSGYFQIASLEGWPVGETSDGVTWINYDLRAVVHAFYTRFDTPPNRLQLFGYAAGQLDKGFASYDGYEVTGIDFAGDPLVMEFALWDEGYKYISRQWFGVDEDVGWFLRIVVPDNYPDLLDYLGEILLPTYRVFPGTAD